MEYKCKRIPMVSLVPNHLNFTMPLCNSCATKDCTNPIERKMVSVVGINHRMRLYSRIGELTIVCECEGFLPGEPSR